MDEAVVGDLKRHAQVVGAFQNIEDKNALGWSILDTKSEATLVRAVALSANRIARTRVAYVEFPPRVDLVFVHSEERTRVVAAYEAKAAYASDFQDNRVQDPDWYLGACIDDDLTKLCGLRLRYPLLEIQAGLFFIYEVSPTTKLLKYGGRPEVSVKRVEEALGKTVQHGSLQGRVTIDCGKADGAQVSVHMFVFEPKTGL